MLPAAANLDPGSGTGEHGHRPPLPPAAQRVDIPAACAQRLDSHGIACG